MFAFSARGLLARAPMPAPAPEGRGPLLFAVSQTWVMPMGVAAKGRVVSGVVRRGQALRFLPSGGEWIACRVDSIEAAGQGLLEWADGGEVSLLLTGERLAELKPGESLRSREE